jgi:twitching motility protein PilT
MSSEATATPKTATALLEGICRVAMRAEASDVHIKSGVPPFYRVHGDLQPVPRAPVVTPDVAAKMAWEIMSPLMREKFKKDNEADFSWAVANVGRYRVNVFRQRGLIGLVLRTIPALVKTIDELGLPEVLKKLAREPRGLILVTGTTGSGKSTTLAAMVEEINLDHACHVITIEDPIEFNFRDQKAVINQREVGSDTGSFPAALRAALREDPDVILVGEMRDLPTIEIGLAAAETGHLVLSTVHALNAPETINRVVSFFEPHHQQHVRLQLSGTLKAVISQRLLPRKGGGRLAAMEIMLNTGSVSECIVDPQRTKEIPDLVAQGHSQYGSQTFDQALYAFYRSGVIDYQEALRYATSPDNLALKVSGIGEDA